MSDFIKQFSDDLYFVGKKLAVNTLNIFAKESKRMPNRLVNRDELIRAIETYEADGWDKTIRDLERDRPDFFKTYIKISILSKKDDEAGKVISILQMAIGDVSRAYYEEALDRYLNTTCE